MKIENLSVSINKNEILSQINLDIKDGSIFTLLGVNGAGKTTLMKVILGLIKPDSGKIFYQYNRKPKIGFVIETPTFYEYLTGFQNLKYYSKILNSDIWKINSVLEVVGLKNEKKLVKNYSLGMRQRLAIARAMLGEPEILVLDEPINGLDPKGIYELRNLFLKLNKEKQITIFLSSHLIKETESIATDYAILNNGTIINRFLDKEIHELTKNIDVLPNREEDTSKIIESVKATFPETLYLVRNGHIKFFTKVKDNEVLIKIGKFLMNRSELRLKATDIVNGELEEFFLAVTE